MRLLTRILLALVTVLCVQRVVVEDTTWPKVQEGLLFSFRDAFTPSYALGADGKTLLGWRFTPGGYGRIQHDGSLLLGGGGFRAEQITPFLSASLHNKEGFTVSLWIAPETSLETGPILTLGAANTWFAIVQKRGVLRVRIATESGVRDWAGGDAQAGLATNITVSRARSNMVIYRDGAETGRHKIPSALLHLETLQLHLGSPSSSKVGWVGMLEGIALYGRALSATEVQALHDAMLQHRSQRTVVPSLRVRAILRGKSTVPTPDDLAPYTQGLTVFLYEVEKVLSGTYDGSQLHVAHWTVLDEGLLPFTSVPEGSIHELRLELYDDNPQLATENLSDDIVTDFSIPYFYDAGGRSLYGADAPVPK